MSIAQNLRDPSLALFLSLYPYELLPDMMMFPYALFSHSEPQFDRCLDQLFGIVLSPEDDHTLMGKYMSQDPKQSGMVNYRFFCEVIAAGDYTIRKVHAPKIVSQGSRKGALQVLGVQSNLAISNSVNSKSLLFRSQADSPLFDRLLVLTRLFQNPAISNYFSCPVGLQNSRVRLYPFSFYH